MKLHLFQVFLFIFFSFLMGCGPSPLESTAPTPVPTAAPSGPISNGSITVTLYNGNLANGSGPVRLIQPDGSQMGLRAGPSCTFTALTEGGTYWVQMDNQVSAQPVGQAVLLTALSPNASVAVQVGGACLSVLPLATQPAVYGFAPQAFYFNVQMSSAPGSTQDLQLDLDPASLPAGWTYSFANALIRGSGSTTLTVNSAEATQAPSATLVLRAKQGALPIWTASVVLSRAWSLTSSLVINSWSFSGNCNKGLNGYGEQQMTLCLGGSGLPSGAMVSVQFTNGNSGQYSVSGEAFSTRTQLPLLGCYAVSDIWPSCSNGWIGVGYTLQLGGYLSPTFNSTVN